MEVMAGTTLVCATSGATGALAAGAEGVTGMAGAMPGCGGEEYVGGCTCIAGAAGVGVADSSGALIRGVAVRKGGMVASATGGAAGGALTAACCDTSGSGRATGADGSAASDEMTSVRIGMP